jgi:SAM-dependent methyltransferase
MDSIDYLMESEEENDRLDLKTDPIVVRQQGMWARVGQNMRIADLGCGSGKTTSVLHQLAQPGGSAVGVDISRKRVEYAREYYGCDGVEFVCQDIRLPLDNLGEFDFVWIRFVLEYYRSNAADIVYNVSKVLKPGGTICLIDLDLNCMNHYRLPDKLERAIVYFMKTLEEKANFDVYAGRKLYSYLYDLGYEGIDVNVSAHHVIYGELGPIDAFNWTKKLEVLASKLEFDLPEYGSIRELSDDFTRFFSEPRRFSYTPMICVCGKKPIRET